jgi:membrane-associated phospholipid phosphatase
MDAPRSADTGADLDPRLDEAPRVVGRSATGVRAAWLLLSLLSLLTVLGGLLLSQGAWDRAMLLRLNAWGPALAHTASALSVLGLGTAVFIVAAGVGVGSRQAQVPAAVLLVLVLGGLAVQLVKSLLGWSRPPAVLGAHELQVIGIVMHSRAMPSGHAALWAAVAVLGCGLPVGPVLRAAGTAGTARRAVAMGLIVLAVVGALSRVVVGAHWPSDVAVGAGLGCLVSFAVAATAHGRALTRWLAELLVSRAGSRATGALVVAASASLWVAEREYPLAEAWYAGLSVLGLWVAITWWRLHPAPWPRWPWRSAPQQP